MAVKLRLRRTGRKKAPTFRIVVADKDSPRDGRFVAAIGTYNPKAEKAADKVQVNVDEAKAWMAKGAQPSDTVARLFRNAGVLPAEKK